MQETFSFDIKEELIKAIADMGYIEPTPIQLKAIPPMLMGRDVIGQAQTGTGKTAAFGIPMINRVDANSKLLQAIVLCPTRELALQTAGEITKLSRYVEGLRCIAVYGGQPIERQLLPLKAGVQIVVGTPGRVMDHMRRGTIDLSQVKLFVLDEADEMLDMGFRDDIEEVISKTPEDRQTALFSATMPPQIMALSQKYLKDPLTLKTETKNLTVDKIEQRYIPVRSFHKGELLARLLIRDEIKRALVFLNTKKGVEDVVTELHERGFSAAGLHGDMRQIERDAIMARFRQGLIGILVATDVAARGLDIDDVEAVFNYDIPLDCEYYVHRIGRTGRAGREGKAYTFVVGSEVSRMWDYRKITKATILCEQAPTVSEITEHKRQALKSRIASTIEEQTLKETPAEDAAVENTAPTENTVEDELVNSLISDFGAEKVIASLLTMLTSSEKKQFNDKIEIIVKEPEPRRRFEGRRDYKDGKKPEGRQYPFRSAHDRKGFEKDDKRRSYHDKDKKPRFGNKPFDGDKKRRFDDKPQDGSKKRRFDENKPQIKAGEKPRRYDDKKPAGAEAQPPRRVNKHRFPQKPVLE